MADLAEHDPNRESAVERRLGALFHFRRPPQGGDDVFATLRAFDALKARRGRAVQ